MINVKVIADTISPMGKRITTLQLRYPRFIHAEVLTHRQFSRSSSSSRAVPVAKVLEQVRERPAMPIHWGKNQAGMQASEELSPADRKLASDAWCCAAEVAAGWAQDLANLGVHKQVANRILEPFQFIHTVVTATEWDNFFELRCHPDAQPEIQALACAMRDAMTASEPKYSLFHLPYITDDELNVCNGMAAPVVYEKFAPISAARCARVSYMKHDGSQPSQEEDLKLFERLLGSKPLHASPAEHPAYASWRPDRQIRNFVGWTQFRVDVEERVSHCRID